MARRVKRQHLKKVSESAPRDHWVRNTRPLIESTTDGDYKVPVRLIRGTTTVDTHMNVRYGFCNWKGGYTYFTHEAVREFINSLPDGLMIESVHAKDSVREEGISQDLGKCNEAFTDTISVALYRRSKRITINFYE